VIGDRHPFVVLRQRVFRRQQGACGARVIDAGIEIRVVGDPCRQMERACLHRRQEVGRMPPCVVAAGALIEHVGGGATELAQRAGAKREKPVESRVLERLARRPTQAFAASACSLEIEDLVADRHANARDSIGLRAEHAERKVLDRKIRLRPGCGLDKAAPRRIVCLIETSRFGHGASDRPQSPPRPAAVLHADFFQERHQPLIKRLCHGVDLRILELAEHRAWPIIFHGGAAFRVSVHDHP
jgi:hypothetical protein